MDLFVRLLHELNVVSVRYVVIGVAGANYYAARSLATFVTKDRDLFLPPDAENELNVWSACERAGLQLWTGDEPLGQPRDRWLAERIVERRMVVAAIAGDLIIDLSLTMGGLDFEAVWAERRTFFAEGVPIPVARLSHIVESKRNAGREKDLNFLITHEQALRDLLGDDDETH